MLPNSHLWFLLLSIDLLIELSRQMTFMKYAASQVYPLPPVSTYSATMLYLLLTWVFVFNTHFWKCRNYSCCIIMPSAVTENFSGDSPMRKRIQSATCSHYKEITPLLHAVAPGFPRTEQVFSYARSLLIAWTTKSCRLSQRTWGSGVELDLFQPKTHWMKITVLQSAGMRFSWGLVHC